MKSILSIALLIAAFFQTCYCYCIYNKLTDGGSFDITQYRTMRPVSAAFSKTLGTDGVECCSYQTKDCSYRQINYDSSFFKIYFHWPNYDSYGFAVRCKSGGALVIQGDQSNFWAECTDANGSTERVDLIPSGQSKK